ncbi:MFS transporter [Bailinhaonella thermotolerans]|uniref:MFS transporter n=2 Tax=Bailinhaonella thermotolerans TaxID=1070861 RepID=A0A3A4B1Q1_9ACTN|nr:MFS transporter [Bailinhaonella thermotolerans]
MALVAIAGAQLMVVLDATIVNVALPSLQRGLGLSTENLSWVINAYTLAFGGLLLLGGRVGDVAGRRRVLVIGVTLFAASSLAGGFAQSSGWLLLARAAQGLGAAAIAPAVLALTTTTFTEGRERNRAFGLLGGVSGAGAAVGLLAGGLLTEWASWRWVFFVNVPVGLALGLLARFSIHESPRQKGRFDLGGALTSTCGMVALVYGFIRVSRTGWNDGWVIGCFAVSLALFIAFVVIERRSAHPLTPLSLFAGPTRAGVYLVALALTGSLMGLFFFLTVFMQNVLSYGPVETGLAFLPVSVTILLTAALTANLASRLGHKTSLAAGVTLIAVALVWLSGLSAGSGYAASLLGPLLLYGVGTGVVFTPLTVIGVSGAVEPGASGAASGLLNATQQVGGALGLSILVTVYGAAARGATGAPAAVLTSGVSTALRVAAIFAVGALAAIVFMIRSPGPGRETTTDRSSQ